MINMTLATLHPNTFPAPDRSWPCGPLDFPRLLTCIHDNPKQPSLKTPVRRCHGQLTTAIISTPRLAASPQAFCSSARPFVLLGYPKPALVLPSFRLGNLGHHDRSNRFS